MWSDWLVVCDGGFRLSALWCPLSVPTVLLGFLLPWMWGISSRLLQQSAATAPYLGRGVAPLSHAHAPSLNHQVDRVNRSAEVSQCPSLEWQSFILLFTGHLLTLIPSSSGSLTWLYSLSCSIDHTHYIPYLFLSLRTVLSRKWKSYLLSRVLFFVTPWTVALQAPLSMEFSRQGYGSG